MGMADEATMSALQAHYQPTEADARLHVTFMLWPLENEEKSALEGRPIYEEVEFIKIVVPGDRENIVQRPVWAKDRQRFARQYLAWKAGQDQDAVTGTPLSAWPGITRGQVEEMKHFNIRSVEQLADLSDEHAGKFRGINALRSRARDFLATAKDGAHLTQMRQELSTRDNEIENLKRMLKEQGEKIAELGKSNTNKKQ